MTDQNHRRVSDEVRELLTKSYDLKLQCGGTTDIPALTQRQSATWTF